MAHPKALWFGKNVKASGGGKVRLKHRELFLNSSVKNAAIDVVEKSRVAVRDTLAKLASTTDSEVKGLVDAFFYTDTPGDIRTIMATFELVNSGICGNVNFKTSLTSNKRLSSMTGKSENSNIEGYIMNYSKRKGDIHVSRNYVLNNTYQAVRTFIHEASHRYASTTDETYFWPPTDDSNNWSYSKPENLVKSKLLKNADSYAYLAMFLGYK